MQQRIFILVLMVLSLFSGRVSAQDPLFSQFFANPIYLNPAFAGANVCPRVALNFRDQWPSIPSTFMTYTASYDQHFDKIMGGIGVIFMGDRAGKGMINTYSASAMYSFRVKISRQFQMRFALQGGYQQKSLEWGKLTFGDMIDPRFGYVYETQEEMPEKTTAHCFDLAAGFIGYTEYLYFGFAAHHITQPYEGFTDPTARLPLKLTGHIGAYIDLKRKSKKEKSFGDVSISPNIIYQHQQSFHYLNTGLYVNINPFTVGIWLRNSFEKEDPMKALIFMCGFQHEVVRIAYSYDITLGQQANMTGGAHEVSLQFHLKCPEKVRSVKDLNCPSF